MKAVTLLLAAAAFGVQANQDEHESHGAHEHGHGHLNLVLDGNQLMIELQAPAADLVGFEQAAKTDAEKAQYAKAVSQLKKPDALFRFDTAADCSLTRQEINTAGAEHAHDHEEAGHDQDEHPHNETGHADLGAMYTYTCATPARLTGLEATLFTVYPSLEKLSAQGILPTGQTAAELTPSAYKLSW